MTATRQDRCKLQKYNDVFISFINLYLFIIIHNAPSYLQLSALAMSVLLAIINKYFYTQIILK